ncbi:MAG: TonB-dependent siderophore receptor [Cyanobacteria bacterium P01_B01_bin.77]
MTLGNRVLLLQLVGAIALVGMQPVSAMASASAAESIHIAQAGPVTITNIQIDETASGLTLRFDTSGELSPTETYIIDNTAFADLANVVLQLPEGEDFVVSDPAMGITLVRVTALADNQVRVAITGMETPPVVDISIGETGLSAIAIPGTPTQSAQTPDSESLRIVVTGEDTDDDYFLPNASTATRTDTPLRDIPQSIQVIPRQVIEDQQATSIEEVLDNAASVTFLGDLDSQGLNFAVRGFDDAPLLRDGFRLLGFAGSGGATTPEVANLEQVEVLKGPASVLYGQAEPGGLINLVSKQPLSEPYYNIQLQGGNREISPSVDLSGPLTEDGRVLYRLNALYRYEDGFRDFDTSFDRFFIAPTVSWAISDRTDLTFNLEYIDDNDPVDFGTVLVGDGDTVIPNDRVINNPDDTIEKEYLNLGYTFEHRFSDNWQLRNRFSFISDEFDYSVVALPFLFDEATGTATRGFTDRDSDDDYLSLYTNLQGMFNTGSIEHTLLFGVDVSRSEGSSVTRFSPMPEFLTFFDIFNPDYSTPAPASEDIAIAFGSDITTDRLGIYVQDQIDLLDNLILAAGLRYDTVEQEITNILTDVETDQSDDAITPRIGIVYQPIEPISLYANYARSFNPNGGTDAQGQAFEPQEGEGFEVGVRAELLENRLAATLAYFNITKSNVLAADPDVPFASIATGEQRSQGIDLDIIGEILPGWNIVASYAYIDAEITEDTTDIVGNHLIGIPEHSASLWTTYQIQSGDLEGLGFGLGFNFVDERQGDLANNFAADSYFTTNAAVFYRRDNWRLGLNIDNLFDVDYIESVNGFSFRQVQPGDPLTVRASVAYTF